MLNRIFKGQKGPEKPREIDASSIPYYPLPPAPTTWDLEEKESYKASEQFEVSGPEATTFRIGEIRKLEMEERPNTAYREVVSVGAGLLYMDKRGKIEMGENNEATVMLRREEGETFVEVGLQHDIYRIGSNPKSDYIAFLSSEAILHSYDAHFSKVQEIDLENDPRIRMYLDSDIGLSGPLRTKIRAVDIAGDGRSHLFTIADAAFLIDQMQQTLWAVTTPLNEKWERVYRKGSRVGQSAEVDAALSFLGLKLPVTKDQIDSRYRALALKWHPDHNPGVDSSTARMQNLNANFEILTGLDPTQLEVDSNTTELHYRRTKPDESFTVHGITVEISFGGQPLDWIYAASIASDSMHTYVGSYAGKIYKLDRSGVALYTIDVGNTPRQIFDLNDYLYILTDTRLYILNGQLGLEKVIDVFQEGKLMVDEHGFGMYASKKISWYSTIGELEGVIHAKHPIRSFRWVGEQLHIETRQHRAIISTK